MEYQSENSNILIAGETPANQKQLTEILSGRQYRVTTFRNGTLALAAIKKSPPDLILLGTALTGLNGAEVCGQLKADPVLSAIPVLFICARNEPERKREAFSAGGADYISHPFQHGEVISRVGTHLQLRKLQFELNRQNHHVEELVEEKVTEISNSQHATIIALASLAASRDETTGTHIERTRSLCRILAKQLHHTTRYSSTINETFIESIYRSAPLHDIGKVGIPDTILRKPSKLTPAEYEIMKTHTTIGAAALQSAHKKYPRNAFLNMGIAIARSHHEMWNGNGYPDGLIGEDIPLSARIMAVADVYDSLRCKRPYKPAFPHAESVEMIVKLSGIQFDPLIVETFESVELILEKELDKLVTDQT